MIYTFEGKQFDSEQDGARQPGESFDGWIRRIKAAQLRATINVSGKPVPIVRKVSTGLRRTPGNEDGRYERMWALGTDGRVYVHGARTHGYRLARPDEKPSSKLFES